MTNRVSLRMPSDYYCWQRNEGGKQFWFAQLKNKDEWRGREIKRFDFKEDSDRENYEK